MSTFVQKFTQNFIENTRYMYLLKGLGNTIIITVFALMIGIVLGFLVAVVRSTHEKHGGLNVLNFICKVYLDGMAWYAYRCAGHDHVLCHSCRGQ